jgi:hypothetical protein
LPNRLCLETKTSEHTAQCPFPKVGSEQGSSVGY